MLCAAKGCEKQSTLYYCATFLAAAYATYLKEQIFGVVAIIVATNLIFGENSRKDRIFYCSLLANSAIFVAIYVYRHFFRDQGKPYAQIISNFSELSFAQFNNEPILYLIATIAFIRTYSILIKKDKSRVFTDSLLFAGVGNTLAYSLLKLYSPYYVFPSILLSIPALAVFLSKGKKFKIIGAVLSAILCSLLSIRNSKEQAINIWKHREEDHFIFDRLINEYQSGKDVYWISLEYEDPLYKKLDKKKFEAYEFFLNYYFGRKFPLKKIMNLDQLTKNSVAIFSEETALAPSFSVVSKKLEEKGLKLSQTLTDLTSRIYRSEN
jgi:hypothetical protein